MRELVVSGIIVGSIAAAIAIILVLSGGELLTVAEGWSRAASLAFLFSIACALIPKEEKTDDSERPEAPDSREE